MDYRVFDTLLDAVFVVDAQRKLAYANDALANLCGTSLKRIKIGYPASDLITFAEPGLWIAGKGEWSTLDASYKEVTFKSNRGREGKVLLATQRSPTVDSSHWIVVLRDVTLEESLQRKYRIELEKKEQALRELEDYNLNLERKVEERTAEVKAANRTIAATMDSLGQGLLVFGSDGICLKTYSKACEDLLEGVPAQKRIADVLRVSESKRSEFQKWVSALFSELLPVEDLVVLGPQTYPHSKGHHIALKYRPMRAETGAVQGIVVVATDLTRERQAAEEAQRERKHAHLVTQIVRSRNQFHHFLRDLRSLIVELKSEVGRETAAFSDVALWYRKLHTLKGDAGSFALAEVEQVAHQCEERLSILRKNAAAAQMEEVQLQLRGLTSELERVFERFLTENLEVIGKGWDRTDRLVEIPASQIKELADTLRRIPQVGSLSDTIVSQFLEEPLELQFSHFGGVVDSLAKQLGKRVGAIRFKGGELRTRPEALSEIVPPLIHAFRNAVDHGIEVPAQREVVGKPVEGVIECKFERTESGGLLIEIADDGKGIDPVAIRRKLEKEGRAPKTPETDEQVIQHVFDSGLSTREEVTLTSGRGVGMDAIRAAAQAVGGKAWVSSRLGKGSVLHLLIPNVWKEGGA